MPYTNRTQTLLFPCRININFCFIRTLNRRKLHFVLALDMWTNRNACRNGNNALIPKLIRSVWHQRSWGKGPGTTGGAYIASCFMGASLLARRFLKDPSCSLVEAQTTKLRLVVHPTRKGQLNGFLALSISIPMVLCPLEDWLISGGWIMGMGKLLLSRERHWKDRKEAIRTHACISPRVSCKCVLIARRLQSWSNICAVRMSKNLFMLKALANGFNIHSNLLNAVRRLLNDVERWDEQTVSAFHSSKLS